MGSSFSTSGDGDFWDQYVALLQQLSVREAHTRWYVVRIEQFLKAYPDVALSAFESADVASYLQLQLESGRLEDWQFAQSVDAIQILFVRLLRLDWADSFDWHHWKHAPYTEMSNADQLPNTGKVSPAASAVTNDQPNKSLTSIRSVHAALLRGLIGEIRRRAYSIRTEQAYEARTAMAPRT